MNLAGSRHRPAPHIPFIALADIAWQIIIFFLVAATFALSSSMNVDLPAGTSQPQAKSQAETITVQAGENLLMINNKNVPMDQLQAELARQLKGRTSEQDRAVIVLGRQDLTFQRHCDILLAVQRAGGILVMSDDGAAESTGSGGGGDQP